MRLLLLLCALSISAVLAGDAVCRRVIPQRRGPRTADPVALPAGNYRLCIMDGSGSLTLRQCTRETFRINGCLLYTSDAADE